MQEHFTRGDFPYQTGNVALAFTLYLSGIPFADENNPLVNSYDAKTLTRLGFPGAIEEQAAAAFAQGVKGNVEYGFAQTIQMQDVKDAFDAHQKAAALTDDRASTLVGRLLESLTAGILSQPQAIAGSTCIVLKRWRLELPEWHQNRDFTLQEQKHIATDYNAAELARGVLLAGGFFPFAAVVMDARAAFLKLWRNYPPQIRLHRAGRPNRDGERVKMPGFVYFTHAENDTRRNLGIPTK